MLFEKQESREAFVKLLLLARYTDNKLSLAETSTFDNILVQLDWQGVLSEYSFKNKAIAQVREAFASEAALSGFITEQCALISDPEERRLSVDKIQSLLMADGLLPEEGVMLERIQQAFATA